MKMFLFVIVTPIIGALLSLNIPFVYTNIECQIFITGYILLYLLYMYVMVQEKKYRGKRYKPYRTYEDLKTIKDRILFLVSNFIMPLGAGWFLTLSTPILSEYLATDFEVREYRVSELIQTSRKMGSKIRVIVTDIRGDQASFIVSPDLASDVGLHKSQKLVVTGRHLPVGLVIDNINGVKR
jgi:hypothetical protein